MRQIIASCIVVAAILLPLCMAGRSVANDCEALIELLEQNKDPEQAEALWKDLSCRAAYLTPYDLIRSGEQAAGQYFAFCASNGDSTDIASSKKVFIAAIREIARIHTLSPELIL